MPLPTPNLDDRTFQDLVDEAKRMIPKFCPEWTDHNVSDPGVTLIELFAWMVDILLFRLNRVPEKSQIAFLDLMGVHLQPAQPARVDLTVWLSAPAEAPITLPAATQVATEQTSSDPAVTFSTDVDLVITPPKFSACFTSPNERVFDDQTLKLSTEGETFMIFSPRPRPGDALYLGFANDISAHVLGLWIDASVEGIGVDPRRPPLVWQVWMGDAWLDLGHDDIEQDGTNGLNQAGLIVLHLPPAMQTATVNDHEAFWVRCMYVAPEPGQPTYSASPVIDTIRAQALGGRVPATHCVMVSNTILGRSDGSPGQRFYLDYVPVLPRYPEEYIEVQTEDGGWVAWAEQETFSHSSANDLHYTLDGSNGEIAFGPSIREPDGITRQYGAIPQRNSLIRMKSYRTGGGAVGNVGAGTIKLLQSAVPYVDRVINRDPAVGGRDTETLEHAALRAPQLLRTRSRAVTAEDYEFLAWEASSEVARVHCLQPRQADALPADHPDRVPPGSVKLLLVPAVSDPLQRIYPEQLSVSPQLRQKVRAYLDERRQLTTEVLIDEPPYVWVKVEAQVRAHMMSDAESVRQAVLKRLYTYLNPIIGGREGAGWPFGRTLYVSELYALLQGLPGLEYVEEIRLARMVEGRAEVVSMVELPPQGLLASAEHVVTVRA